MEQNLFDENAPKKLPSSINVLTILTFIGSAFGIIGGIWGFISADKSVEQMEKVMGDPAMQNMPGFVKDMMSPEALELAKAQAANKMPILLLTLIGAVLCIYGAVQMRKLKQQGYFVYLIGEILPILCYVIFVGIGVFKGMALIGLIFPVLFIILYTVNKKHLTN